MARICHKNIISGFHQAGSTSRRKHTHGWTEIQDGDTNLMQTVSTCPEDNGSSFPDRSLGSKPKKKKTLGQTQGKIPHKVNFSPLLSDSPTFDYQSLTYISQDYSDFSDSDEGYDWEFPPPTEKPDVLLEDMAQPQLSMPTEPDSAPNWSPVQSMYRVTQKSSMSESRTSLEIFLVTN